MQPNKQKKDKTTLSHTKYIFKLQVFKSVGGEQYNQEL